MMALAELEREQTSWRMLISWKTRAEKGLWTGGIVPLGYDLGENAAELVVNQEEAHLVVQIFEKYLEYGSLRQLAKHLNDTGYRTKTRIAKSGNRSGGRKFAPEILRKILRRTEYIGIQRINIANKDMNQEDLDEFHRYSEAVARWEPIVPDGMFQEVQELMDVGKTTGHSPAARGKHTYLLPGLLYCSSCLKGMKTDSTKKSEEKSYFRYTCKNPDCNMGSIPAEKIESIVIDKISELAFLPDVLTRIIEETNSRLNSELPRWKKELRVLQRRLSVISDRISDAVSALGKSEGDAQREANAELKKFTENKNDLETIIEKTEAKIQGCNSNRIITEAVVTALDYFALTIRTLNAEDQHQLIRSVVNKVYWDGDKSVRLAIYGNSALFSSDSLTRIKKCAERPYWRLVEDSNLRPSG